MKIPFSGSDFLAYLATGFVLLSAADYAFDLGWLQKEKLPPGMLAAAPIAVDGPRLTRPACS